MSRCTAQASGLDDEICGRCLREHTDMLVEAFELGTLWDEYGLVGDVVVSFFFLRLRSTLHLLYTVLAILSEITHYLFFCSCSQIISLGRTYTSSSHLISSTSS